jgi:peptidyl-dipeptidase Dcp
LIEETATSFKNNILAAGGSEHPSILYKRFRGREPKPEALLKRAGLLNLSFVGKDKLPD